MFNPPEVSMKVSNMECALGTSGGLKKHGSHTAGKLVGRGSPTN